MEKDNMFVSMNQIYVKSSVALNISVIKDVFLILCIYYTNFKITNKKIELNFKFIRNNFIIVVFGVICGIIKNDVNFFISIISSILIISLMFSKDKITRAIISTSISFAINYTISFITIIINFMFNLTTQLDDDYINLIVILISHFILLYLFFKIRRFKNGFSFLNNDNKNEYIDILVLNIGVIILFLIAILIHSDVSLAKELTLGTTTAIIIMFTTIKKSLQIYYKQKLLSKT